MTARKDKIVLDPLTWLSGKVALDDYRKDATQEQFNNWWHTCENFIEKNGQITDREVVKIGLETGYLQHPSKPRIN